MKRLLEPFYSRRGQYAVDLVVLISAFALAYLLRFDFVVPVHERRPALYQLPLVLLIQLSALWLLGAYSFVWRYVGIAEADTFARAAAWSSACLVLLRLGLPDPVGWWRVPLSVIIIDTVLAFGGVLGARVVRRSTFEYSRRRHARSNPESAPVRPAILLIGAGREGVRAARELLERPETNLEVKGFVDDDPLKQGAIVGGVKVLGSTADLPRLVAELGIDHVVITIPDAPRQTLRRLLGICQAINVRVRAMPTLADILQGRVSISRFQDVRPEDLLGRPTVEIDNHLIGDFLTGRTVLVSGAGGSIGSELARQVARHGAAKLLLVERAEGALFQVDRELRENASQASPQIFPLLADIGDRARMGELLAQFRPEVIVHAAAHKHVPLMEDNSGEAIKNNVFGTLTLGELAGEAGTEAFVMISTDKAVRPASIMGASKRLAELVIQDLGLRYRTRYVTVRFGNVMGSAGSVVPLFQEQIARGGPVTVTHPEMTRYFMTIPEAVALVLEAGAMGLGGEIFVLDMGDPVKILDLAKRLIDLSGSRPFDDIDIVFTGTRPGEKLFEELQVTGEAIGPTRHPKILIGNIAGMERGRIGGVLARLKEMLQGGRTQDLRALLSQVLPEAQLGSVHSGGVASPGEPLTAREP